MKYTVTIGQRADQVEVEADGRIVRANRQQYEVALERVPGTPLVVLRHRGMTRVLSLERQGDHWVVGLLGERLVAEVLDEPSRRARAVGSAREARVAAGVLRAPMPGLVVRLEVKPGDVVTAGTGLVVLEAMKMENEIRAPAAGVVKTILVSPGQAVEKGTPLLELTHQG